MLSIIIDAILAVLPLETIITTIVYSIVEYFLGKTTIVKSNSLLELTENLIKVLFGAVKKKISS